MSAEKVTKIEDKKKTNKDVLKDCIKNLNLIKTEMKNMFLEREDVIDASVLALATSSHVLLYGPPGTGKSLITREIANRIDNSNYFEWLLTKGTDISELFGGLSIKGMEQDKYIRNVKGKLPEADIVFLDEIYKSNSPTLNSLLTAINERVFHNDGQAINIPLITMFAASNEIPEEEDGLAALHDRFLTRLYVEDIHDMSNMIELYNRSLDGTFTANGNSKTTVTMKELKTLQMYIPKVQIPSAVLQELAGLMFTLKKEGISISARRQVAALKLMQGKALLEGRTKVDFIDFKCLKPVLWEKVSDIDMISDEIDKIKDPFTSRFEVLSEAFFENKAVIENQSSQVTPEFSVVLSRKGEISDVIKRLDKLIKDADSSGFDTKRFNDFKEEMTKFIEETVTALLNPTSGNSGSMDDMDEFPDVTF